MIARTPYGDLPRALVEELAEAGLDPRAVYEMVVSAFDEDLPEGSRRRDQQRDAADGSRHR